MELIDRSWSQTVETATGRRAIRPRTAESPTGSQRMGQGCAMYKFMAVFLLLSSSASAEVNVFLDFASWEKEPEAVRSAYIAGAFDSLVLFTVDEQTRQAGQFFQRCVSAAKLNSTLLSENVRAYAKPRLELQAGTVQAVLLRYLIALCGRPSPA
jgi:hypothetical protein